MDNGQLVPFDVYVWFINRYNSLNQSYLSKQQGRSCVQSSLNERDWKLLLKRIADGKCTPIIGSSINQKYIPGRQAIAASWVSEFGYPLPDNSDLARVAQYLAVEYDPYFPKEELQKQLESVETPDFDSPNQPHAILADLQLPIYITTNYDNFMIDALSQRGKKDPRRELCRWNPYLLRSHPSVLETGFKPTPANPLVYHLHGQFESPESLVLTEDDYLDFLVNISSNEYELPSRIQRTLTDSSLLFIGFRPEDWDFRVLFRGLVAAAEEGLRRISVTVQLPPLPENSAAAQEKSQRYLNNYFDQNDRQMRVYWGSTEDFLAELNQRWKAIEKNKEVTQASKPSLDLMQFQINITESFNLQELRQLVTDLGIDFETFTNNKPAFILELVTYMQRRGRLYELTKACQQLRSHLHWM